MEEGSDSDGYLPENLEEGAYDAASESDSDGDSDEGIETDLQKTNKELRLQLAVQKMKLDRLLEKDPEFAEYLEAHADKLDQDSYCHDPELSELSEAHADELEQDSDYGDFDEDAGTSDQDKVEADSSNGKALTTSIINSWCQMVLEGKSLSVLPNLLNAYRGACQYDPDDANSRRIQSSKVFCKIVNFTLREADNIFRSHLGISLSDCNQHTVLELQNSQKWKDIKPLIRSYLSSTIKFLDQVTDSEIVAFSLTRLRASAMFFAAFPSLLQKLIKVTVYFLATGEGKVPSASFLIISDTAPQLSLNCRQSCLIKAYKAFIANNKLGLTYSLHIKSRVDSLVKLYSLDVSRSYSKALVSIQQLAEIAKQGLQTKKKEAKQKICSWQYINCVDLWVKFVCANVGDDNVRKLVFLIVQIINAVAELFPEPQHLPLRVKCVQMLNELSSFSRQFIPVIHLVLGCMEYIGTGKPDPKSAKPFHVSYALKVRKQWVNSRLFQEECVLSVIELLSAHFAQWSYQTAFPGLAHIALFRLRKFHEKITVESLRSRVECLMKMVEQNVEFVDKKRKKVAFPFKDEESAASFNPEKSSKEKIKGKGFN
ncbi:nucleolar complex protein 2 homolog [Papaver somniferum]|uniref:nucleolar complex protein 2 homolog n=1 Tax=Papaver somniferum TaxID=3469 RepID=UPI000E6FA147|nr:nucleolar complex protein 2 homolog [Papaver somniferum]